MSHSVVEIETDLAHVVDARCENICSQVGAVTYLNSKPLIEGLSEVLPRNRFKLDYPSRLADDLAVGKLDVALIPSVEYILHPEYEIVSDACVATHGPVLSVKMYSRVPLGKIRSLALDEGSRTSAALTRLMLRERYGVEPNLMPLPLTQSTEDTAADAVVLIGDRAIAPPKEAFLETWDLGEEWVSWTGLPFVFAMWVARKNFAHNPLEQILCNARDRGVEKLAEIAQREAPLLNLTEVTAYNYLKNNLYFRLGSAERQGLALFQELVSDLKFPGTR